MHGLEAPDELQLNTVGQYATKSNSKKRKPTFHACKEPRLCKNQSRQLEKKTKRTN